MRIVTPEHWRKLHVVRCGPPTRGLPEHAPPNPVRRVIAIGRLSPEKGHAGLLEAFAAVSRDHEQLELVVVGDGQEGERLRARARELGIPDRVRFAGRLGEREALEEIAQADILVLSSFMEGLPIVLMEAMAMGTAVIASRVAGIPELIDHGESGLLFTPSKWDELAASIRRLKDDDTLRQALVRSGRETVAKEFNIERSAAQLQDLFQSK